MIVDYFSKKPKKPARAYKCGLKICKRRASRFVSWFDLTGEYKNQFVAICREHWDAVLFEREVKRQAREQTADADELISGDFEE